MRLFRGRCLQRASPPHTPVGRRGAVHVSADAQFLQARNIRWHAVSDDAQCRMAYLTRRYAGDLALAAEHIGDRRRLSAVEPHALGYGDESRDVQHARPLASHSQWLVVGITEGDTPRIPRHAGFAAMRRRARCRPAAMRDPRLARATDDGFGAPRMPAIVHPGARPMRRSAAPA